MKKPPWEEGFIGDLRYSFPFLILPYNVHGVVLLYPWCKLVLIFFCVFWQCMRKGLKQTVSQQIPVESMTTKKGP